MIKEFLINAETITTSIDEEIAVLQASKDKKVSLALKHNNALLAFLDLQFSTKKRTLELMKSFEKSTSIYGDLRDPDFTVRLNDVASTMEALQLMENFSVEPLVRVGYGCVTFIGESLKEAYHANTNTVEPEQYVKKCERNLTIRISPNPNGRLVLEGMFFVYVFGLTFKMLVNITSTDEYRVSGNWKEITGDAYYETCELTDNVGLLKRSMKWGGGRSKYLNDFSVY